MTYQPNRVSRCNGEKAKPSEYSVGATELFYRLLPEVRQSFADKAIDPSLWQGEVKVGERVLRDETVFNTLRSWATEAEFMSQPRTWIVDALQDCAERDWFYANEKRWV